MLQQFDLPANEHLLAVEKKSFPFYWHEKCEENLRQKYNQDMKLGLASSGSWQPSLTMSHDIQLTNHTVLDGCIIVTDASVYEMKPRYLFGFFSFWCGHWISFLQIDISYKSSKYSTKTLNQKVYYIYLQIYTT